jgi:phage/plasmid-associated DNA primase
VSNDPVGQFVSRCCKLGDDLQCEKDDLYEAFVDFREQYGISENFNKDVFLRQLYERFHSVKQKQRRLSDGVRRVLVGIALNDAAA